MPKGRQKGFTHSAEARAKMSAAKKGKPGRKLSALEKMALSIRMSNRIVSEETRKRISLAKLSNPIRYWLGKKRGPSSEKQKRAVSLSNRGRSHRLDQCRFPYNGTWFRSRWEVRVAKALDALRVRWEYESKRFDLGTETYLPDFYLPDDEAYWEVKGFFGEKSQRTTMLFRKLYSEPLVLVNEALMVQLERAAINKAA